MQYSWRNRLLQLLREENRHPKASTFKRMDGRDGSVQVKWFIKLKIDRQGGSFEKYPLPYKKFSLKIAHLKVRCSQKSNYSEIKSRLK